MLLPPYVHVGLVESVWLAPSTLAVKDELLKIRSSLPVQFSLMFYRLKSISTRLHDYNSII